VKAGNLREDLYYGSAACVCGSHRCGSAGRHPNLDGTLFYANSGAIFSGRSQHSARTPGAYFRNILAGKRAGTGECGQAIVALGDESVAMGGLRAMLSRPNAGVNGGQVSLKQAARRRFSGDGERVDSTGAHPHRWNRRRAAQDLQISYKALLYKLKQMGCSEYRAS